LWSRSNIRQWLNSNAAAGAWYSPQHDYDTPPTLTEEDFGDEYLTGSYEADPGFLAGFNSEFISHLTEVEVVTMNPFIDLSGGNTLINGVADITHDKVFLASVTEIFGDLNKHTTTNMSTGK
jgi:hypothetical protein